MSIEKRVILRMRNSFFISYRIDSISFEFIEFLFKKLSRSKSKLINYILNKIKSIKIIK
jgi:hypothetical protein